MGVGTILSIYQQYPQCLHDAWQILASKNIYSLKKLV